MSVRESRSGRRLENAGELFLVTIPNRNAIVAKEHGGSGTRGTPDRRRAPGRIDHPRRWKLVFEHAATCSFFESLLFRDIPDIRDHEDVDF